MTKINFAEKNGFNNVALIIGINNYNKSKEKFKPLNNAAKDAVDLATLLHYDYQYAVHLMTDDEQVWIDKERGNLPFDSVEQPTYGAIDTFLKKRLPQIVLENNKKQDTCFLFYFAGHGEAEKSDTDPKGFLIPKDAQDDRTNWLEMTQVFTDLSESGCHHVLTVLDSCYSGASLWAVVGRGAEIVRSPFYKEHLKRYKDQKTQLLMYSAAYNQEASDGNRGASNESENSPFAAALINVLKNNAKPSTKNSFASRGIITASHLFSEVQQSLSNAHQQPGFYPLKREFVGREYIFYNPQFDETELGNAPLINEQNNPYRGLQAFEQRHAALFRGRAVLTEKLCACLHLPVTNSLENVQSKLEYLQSQASGEESEKPVLPLTIVLGNSGSGKSSLVQAGLLPLLHQIQFAHSWEAATSNEEKRAIFQDYSSDRKGILKILGMKEQETALRKSVNDFPKHVRKFLPAKQGKADDRPGEDRSRVNWRILDPIRPGEKPFMSLARAFLPIERPDLLNHEVLRCLDLHFKKLVEPQNKQEEQEQREQVNKTKAAQLSPAELAKIQFAQSWDDATREARLLIVRDYYDIEKNTIQDIELLTLPSSESVKDFYTQVKTALEDLDKRLDDDSQKDEPTELVTIVQKWCETQKPNQPKLLLVVDQLEELITLDCPSKAKDKSTKDKPEHSVTDRFLNTILTALKTHSDRFQVIMTLRSDFEPRFLTTPLQDWLPYSRFFVRPMSSDELRQAIEEPAQIHALEFNPPELVGQLVDELGQPGALPLLSFVLSELYLDLAERRKADSKDRTLVLDQHKQSGGIVGFLTRRATLEYEKLGGLEYTLDLISPSFGKPLPNAGKQLIAIAQKEQDALHFRIFDDQGRKKDIDLPKAELTEGETDRAKKLEKLKEFKKLLQDYWNGEQIPSDTKEEIVVAFTSITGHSLEVNQYQKMMRQVMLRMVTIEGGSSAKRRVPQSELDYPRQNNEYCQEVINRLVKARLLVEGRDEGEPYYEPAHDYLISGWALLQTWIQQEKEDLALQQRLIPAAKDWNERRNVKPPLVLKNQPTEQMTRWFDARQGLQVAKSVAYVLGRLSFLTIDRIEYVKRRLSTVNRKLFMWLLRKQEVSDRSYEKPADYLWDDHPRINQLSFLLDDRSWLNKLESEFVRHSVVRRQGIRTIEGTIVLGIGIIIAGAGIAAVLGQKRAQIEQAKAATEATDSNLQNGRDLEALQHAINGSYALDQRPFLSRPLSIFSFFPSSIAEQNNLQEALFKSAYLTRERNQLSLNRGNIYQIATIPTNANNVQTKVRIATVEEEDSVRLLDADGKQLFQLSTCPTINETISECTVAYSAALGVVSQTNDNQNEQLLLATGGDNGVIQIWTIKPDGTIDSSSKINLPSAPQSNESSDEFIDESVYELAFNKTGNQLASIQNGKVWLWQRHAQGDWRISSTEITKSTNGTAVVSIAFNPLKDQLAVGFDNGQIEIWDVSNISEPSKLQTVDSDAVDIITYSIAFSQDGKTLAVGGMGGAVKLFSVRGNDIIDLDLLNTNIDTRQPRTYSLAFLDNQELLTVGVSDTVGRYAVNTSEPIDSNPITAQQTEEHQINSAVYSPDGQLIATVADDDSIRLWDRQGRQLARSFERSYYVQSLAFSPDGIMLVSSGSTKPIPSGSIEPDFDGTGVIEVWDLSSQQPDLDHPIATYNEESLAASRNVEFLISNSERLTSNPYQLASLGIDGSWTFLNIDRRPDATTITQEPSPLPIYDKYLAESRNFAYSPTSRQLAVVQDGKIEVWQPETSLSEPIASDARSHYTSVAFSPDGTKLATGSEDGWVRLWDIPLTVDGQVQPGQTPSLFGTSFQTHQQAVNTLAFSPDDPDILITGGADGTVKFWDLSQNMPNSSRLTLRNVQTIAFSPSTPVSVSQPTMSSLQSNSVFVSLPALWQPLWGQVSGFLGSLDALVTSNLVQRLAVIDQDEQFNLWELRPDGSANLSDTNLTPQVKAELAQAKQIVLSPSGNLLVAIANNNTITAWNLESGQAIDWQEDQAGAIKATDAKFSQDGQILITLDENQPLKLWDVTNSSIQPLTIQPPKTQSPETQEPQSTDTQPEDAIDTKIVTALDQVAITPDGQELAILSALPVDEGLIEFWNLPSLEKSSEFRLPQADSQILFSPDGKLIATVGQDKDHEVIKLWNLATRDLRMTLELPELTADSRNPDQISNPEIAFSPDSHLIIATNSEGVLSLWDTEGNFIAQFPGAIKSASFTADGQHLAVVLPNGEISFWSIDRTELLAKACETIRNFKQNSTILIDPQACPQMPSATEAAFSTGEQLLISSATNLYKLAGINRFRENNFSEADQFLDQALQLQPNDPEARIYYNNTKILEDFDNTEANIYTIAVSVPISSDVNGSQEILRGVAQLQKEVNENGGINGAKLRIVIADDQGKEEIAKQVATQLAEDHHVLGVIGHFSSNSSLAAGAIYNERHLAAISPISTSVELSGFGDYFFRTVPNDSQAAQRLADYLLKESPQPNVAIFYNSESNYSESLRREFKNHALGFFNQPIEYDLADPNFDAQDSVEDAKKNGVEALILFANTAELNDALAVVEANADSQLPILAGDDLYTLSTLSTIAEGVQNPNLVVAVPWNIISNQESDFVEKANQLWRDSVNWRTAMAYDAAKAFVEAIQQIEGEPTRELIAQKLKDVDFQGASGQVQFDAAGDRDGSNPQDSGLVHVVNNRDKSRSGTGYDFEPVQTP